MKELEYIVEVEDLTVAYDEKPVLWDIDLKLPKEKLIAIIGPNGAGKTTLLKSILGIIKPVSGEVCFFPGEGPGSGAVLSGYSILKDKKPLKNRIGYVPQSGSVDWDFPATVLDVVLMGCYGKLGLIKRPGKKEKEQAILTLKKVGMEDYSKRQISQLSGGQQQRVFLARALMQDAEIYFMDEPFKGVDAKTEKSIIGLLKDMKAKGKTVIVVHHDLQTVKEYFDWTVLINLHVIASGYVEESFTAENIKNAYQSKTLVLSPKIANITGLPVNSSPVGGENESDN